MDEISSTTVRITFKFEMIWYLQVNSISPKLPLGRGIAWDLSHKKSYRFPNLFSNSKEFQVGYSGS
jgi:hypothetical protein